ncbi:MAG: response regulator [Bryobacterales bacterium]|nr:response regulator [Bryobacterales bacterium]
MRGDELKELRHNLRTPINHILGYSEMMMEDAGERGADSMLGELRKIHEAGKHSLALINAALTPVHDQVTDAELSALHEQLGVPVRAILDGTGALGAEGETADVIKIRDAAERLLALCEGVLEAALPGPVLVEPASSPTPVPRNTNAERREGRLLVVDDIEANRDLLSRRLEREGYTVAKAENGAQALDLLRSVDGFDLVLLDIMMPVMDGYQTLEHIKADTALRDIPVIMITALDDIGSVVRCIEMGAEDYLPKPFDPVLLRARIGASLEKKRLRDEEKKQRKVAESLLRNILPAEVAEELREKGSVEPRYFEDVTILFTDFVGFTLSTENLAAEELVQALNRYFTAFDRIVESYKLEKLKTIGDSYMLAGGLPVRSPSHPVDSVLAAFEMTQAVKDLAVNGGIAEWQIRLGIHTGPVIAGVVGIRKFAFDIWGETVNYASRMESSGGPGRINVSERTYSRVKDFFHCEPRGKVVTKDKREVDMFFVNGILPKLLEGADGISPPPAFVRRYRVYFQKDPPAFPAFLAKGAVS